MLIVTARAQHACKELRLPSDLTDAECHVLEPVMPTTGRRGRRHKWGWRELLDTMSYILRGGLP